MIKLLPLCRIPLTGLFILMAGIALSFTPASAQQPTSYIALEANSGRVLYSQNAEKVRPVAALGQVATAIVALDWVARKKVDLNTLVTVPNFRGGNTGTNPMKLVPGDELTLRDALYSTLLGSDNISALTVAHFVGSDLAALRGKNDSISEFVSEMNRLAHAIGMTNTKFRSPHGLDSGSVSESTAADMALLGIYSMRNSGFVFIVSQPSRKIGVKTASGNKMYQIRNTNPLLKDSGVDGIKTGSSVAAGPCAMIGVQRPTVRAYDPLLGREAAYPQRMIVVVLGTKERYTLSRELIREGWREFDAWLKNNKPRKEGEKRFLFLKGGN